MVKWPPPVWALFYLIAASVASVLYPWKSLVDLTIVPLGAVLIVLGLLSLFWALGIFRAEGTEINPTSPENKKLVVRGLFRFTRNPMYLGLVSATLGIALCVGALPMFVVPILVFATANWVHIPFEEAKMRRQFGIAYDSYTRLVRRWI
jgi:protein-S-isoprenylcysteine O-methyltransferase Ste14